jgi:predicted nucleic acid-binding protein
VRLVLDASVALCWCFRDEQNPLADYAFSHLQNGAEAVVPIIWWFEIRNAITLGVRRNRIDEQGMDAFLKRLSNMLVIIAELPETNNVFAIAQRRRLTFYDAAYLELAQRESMALATLDQALAKAATAEGVALIGA